MIDFFRQISKNDYTNVPNCYGLMATPELEELGIPRLIRYPQLALRGQGALVAVIDTGINLLSPHFLYEDGSTKVAALWDQTDTAEPPVGENGFLPYGRYWSREEINEALAAAPGTLPADEEGHGSFLAAVAAARENAETGFMGAAPDSELLVVKLKQAAPRWRDYYILPDGVWACQEDDLVKALDFSIKEAERMQRPVSVCLGIGTNLGGHDGSSILERKISDYSLKTGVSIHIAGGNEEIAGHHFRGILPEGSNYTPVNFNVAEGEEGFVMELWGRPPVLYTISLTSPGGEQIDKLQLRQGELRRIELFPEETVLEIQSFLGESPGGDQVIRIRFAGPSPGTWQMRVYGEYESDQGAGAVTREFDLWMPISNFMKEETFFLNAAVDETITSPGNAFYCITYTPYDTTNDSLYLRAGRGYTRDGRVKPDLAAPGVAVSVPADLPGGRQKVRSGSSIAAAFGAGLGALMGEWAVVNGNDPDYNGQKLRSYLIQGAVRSGAYSYPNREWGYGIANIYNAFLALRG
ncbi:MAG: S8 family peptidase [Eubacterium sp.]|nr:S8 family peptidase [Eubacterium sp.]